MTATSYAALTGTTALPPSPTAADRPGADPTRPLRLAIIIPNYNYADFVGAAIDSALAVDWPAKQVIVVDDGSTDRSWDVIAGYGDRVTALRQPNAGQVEAYNSGFRAADADVVIFLDSDDLLDPAVMREIAAVWRDGVSKVQFRMRTVDAAGRPLGSVIPQFPGVPSPRDIRAWFLATAAHPGPPGSGNAYASSFLRRIFPLDLSCGRAGDASCIAAAPLLGDVVTIDRPLALYRMHGRNDGAMSRIDPVQLAQHVERARRCLAYAERLGSQVGLRFAPRALDRSLWYLPYRLASLRLAPTSHPVPVDSRLALLADVARAVFVPQGASPQARLALLVWSTLVCLAPRAWAERLVLWRFAPGARPASVGALLRRLRVLR